MLGYHGTAYEYVNNANRLPSRKETWQNNAGTLTLYQAIDTMYIYNADNQLAASTTAVPDSRKSASAMTVWVAGCPGPMLILHQPGLIAGQAFRGQRPH